MVLSATMSMKNVHVEKIKAMSSLWTENQSIDEIKHWLFCTKLELIAARKEANKEIRKYEEASKRLFELLKRVCRERDEARYHLQLLLTNFHQDTNEPKTSSTAFNFDHPSYDISLASSCESRDEPSPKDFSDATIAEAGPLLETLVVSSLLLSRCSPSTRRRHDDDSAKVDDKASVIPTCLSLAFLGNSREPSQMSGSRLSVKTEPCEDMDSNMRESILTGKKRKLL